MVLSICLIFIDWYGKNPILFKQSIHTTVNKAVFKINWTCFLSHLHIHVLIIACQQTFVLKGARSTLARGRSREVTSILLFTFIITYQISSASLFWYKIISEIIPYLFFSWFVYSKLMFPETVFISIQGICWSKLYFVTYVYSLSFI